jgi:hypothetical protein
MFRITEHRFSFATRLFVYAHASGKQLSRPQRF